MEAWRSLSYAQRFALVLFGWHPFSCIYSIYAANRGGYMSDELVIHSIGAAIVWLMVTAIAVGIAGIFSWGAKTINEELVKGQQRYEQLPPAKQIEVDQTNAKVAKYGGAALAGVFSLAVIAINPWLWGGGIVAVRAAARNWREQNENLNDLNAKAKATRS